jgi:hypothetical protein
MRPVERVEKSLERLIPVALSLRATEDIERMLDELAAGGKVAALPPVARLRLKRWHRGFGIAAALVAGILVSLWAWPERLTSERLAGKVRAGRAADSFELLREENRVESAVDEGITDDDGGGVHRLLRYRVVGESVVRNEATGAVVRVVEPREEVLLVPITAF